MKRRNFTKTHSARMYASGRFDNPYFQEEPTPLWKSFVIGFFFLIFVLAGVGYILVSPLLWIRELEITGMHYANAEEIALVATSSWSEDTWISHRHRWRYNSDDVLAQLYRQFDLEGATVVKEGAKVLIDVQEIISAFQVHYADQIYIIDKLGEQVADNRIDEVNLPVLSIIGNAPEPFALNQQTAQQIILIFDAFNDEGHDIGKGGLDLSEPYWMTLHHPDGYDLYVDLSESPEKSVQHFNLIQQQYLSQGGEYYYVDLRFGDRVFIR